MPPACSPRLVRLNIVLMAEPELISVVMPTYNHAAFIGGAIGSVLNQTYSNFELIIVDNYSGDNTEAVVTACGDPRIRYVKFLNKGIIAAARNYGIGLAKGEYVAFLDSDDLWLPEKLAAQLEGFSREGNVAMVYSRFRTITGEAVSGEVLPKVEICVSGNIFRTLYLKHFIACSGVMARRDVLERAGGFNEAPAMVAVEDADLWLRIAMGGRIQCASEVPLFLYRVHNANVSQGYTVKFKRAFMLIVKHRKSAGFFNFIEAAALLSASIIRRKLGDVSGMRR